MLSFNNMKTNKYWWDMDTLSERVNNWLKTSKQKEVSSGETKNDNTKQLTIITILSN